MPSYLTTAQYRSITTLDGSLVDLCTSKGKDVQRWLDMASAHIRSRLVKRYAVDFAAPGPTPDKIIEWLALLVDIPVCKCVGATPEGRVDDWAREDEARVNAELKEAADAENGMFELPLRNTDPTGASAINKGGPFVASNTTIYGFFDAQQTARDSDGW
jgi:hypothetical protein